MYSLWHMPAWQAQQRIRQTVPLSLPSRHYLTVQTGHILISTVRKMYVKVLAAERGAITTLQNEVRLMNVVAGRCSSDRRERSSLPSGNTNWCRPGSAQHVKHPYELWEYHDKAQYGISSASYSQGDRRVLALRSSFHMQLRYSHPIQDGSCATAALLTISIIQVSTYDRNGCR